MGSIGLAAALIAWNSAANRWRPFHSWAYVPANLAMAAVVVMAGFAAFDLDRETMGLVWRDAWVGAALGSAVLVPLGVLLLRRRDLLRDRRLEDVRGWQAAFMVLVRIPIGTALVEETVFRGVLLGSMLHRGEAAALAVSSIAFGLWHVAPTAILVRTNALRRTVVPAGVAGTAAAGLLLGWLRIHTGSVAAPMLVHAVVNSLGAAAAIVAWRRA